MVAVRPYTGSTYHSAYDHPEVQAAAAYREAGAFDHFYVLGGRYGDASYAAELDGIRQLAAAALETGRVAYRTRAMVGDTRVTCTTTVQDDAVTTVDHVRPGDALDVARGDTLPGHADDVLAVLDGPVRHHRCDEPERQIAAVLDDGDDRFVVGAVLPDDAAIALADAVELGDAGAP